MSLRRVRGGRRKAATSGPRQPSALCNGTSTTAPLASSPRLPATATVAYIIDIYLYLCPRLCSPWSQFTRTTMAAHIISLPHDIIILLMQYLSVEDLASLCCTCKILCDMVSPQRVSCTTSLPTIPLEGGGIWMEGLPENKSSALVQSIRLHRVMDRGGPSTVRLTCVLLTGRVNSCSSPYPGIIPSRIVIGLVYVSSHALCLSDGLADYSLGSPSIHPGCSSARETPYTRTHSDPPQLARHLQSFSRGHTRRAPFILRMTSQP